VAKQDKDFFIIQTWSVMTLPDIAGVPGIHLLGEPLPLIGIGLGNAVEETGAADNR
jgi:hypothetical protein